MAFPIILAWRLWKQNGLGNFDVSAFVERAASFSGSLRAGDAAGAVGKRRRDIHLRRLAAVISGLICAADIARAHESTELAGYLESYADWIESHLDEWTTTTEGVLLPGVPYHYMRIRPPAKGEPFHNEQLAPGVIHINNREPGEKTDFEAREVVDGGFLELVRYGIRRADDPLIVIR